MYPAVQDVESRGAVRGGQGFYGDFLYFLPIFTVNLKLLYKSKVY